MFLVKQPVSELLYSLNLWKTNCLLFQMRCLTEGVNIPAVDCVVFVDPKKSVVDIVQATGRAPITRNGKTVGLYCHPAGCS